jgi:hypothetical protein
MATPRNFGGGSTGPDQIFSGHNEGATKCTGARARPEPRAAKVSRPSRVTPVPVAFGLQAHPQPTIWPNISTSDSRRAGTQGHCALGLWAAWPSRNMLRFGCFVYIERMAPGPRDRVRLGPIWGPPVPGSPRSDLRRPTRATNMSPV